METIENTEKDTKNADTIQQKKQKALITEDTIKELRKDYALSGNVLRCSFIRFVAVMHFYIYRKQFTFKKFHVDLINKLQDFVFYPEQRKARNLYIGMPPRFGKSQIIKYFIAWCYCLNPQCNFIFTSYGDELVRKASKEIKACIDMKFYRKLFKFTIDPSVCGADLWQIYGGGAFRAATLQGVITGFGAGTADNSQFGGALIIDDFLKATDSGSVAEKKAVIDAYNVTLKSRLNNPDVPIIIIAQRLAVDDLIGYIEENEKEDWEFYLIKGFDEEKQKSIWESRISTDTLMKMKEQIPFVFNSQYQQEPIIPGGDIFKSEWWQFYNTDERFHYNKIYICADTAMKTGERNDYTCIAAFGVTATFPKMIHLLDMVHGKFEAPDLEKVFCGFYTKWRQPQKFGTVCSAVYIEDKASGTGLIQAVKKKGIPITPIRPNKDKFTRANDAIPFIANGFFKLPNSAGDAISKKVIAECESFRADMSHKHDDIVDVICYSIEHGTRKKGFI